MLPQFITARVPCDIQIARVLVSDRVRKIIHFALGPAGTNISQAADQWSRRKGVMDKSEIVLCQTPEESVAQARQVQEPGVLPVFWTCAVYYQEHLLFFQNPDTLPFLFSEAMLLDQMQLACRPDTRSQPSRHWRVASHPSPAPLLGELDCELVPANSNAHAAQLCAQGSVNACITTNSARRLHGLCTIHVFGSPPMVFFGGTTRHGLELLSAG